MDPFAENSEFINEFAQDCQDILDELRAQFEKLAEQVTQGEIPSAALISGIAQNFQAVRGSAEFLGLDGVFRVAAQLYDFLEGILDRDAMVGRPELEAVDTGIGALDIMVKQLASNGRLERVEPLVEQVAAAIAETTPKPAEPEAVEASPQPEPEPQPEPSAPPVDAPEPETEQDFGAFQITITPEMMEAYITEAEEQLEVVEQGLLGLESNIGDADLLDNVFRGMHTFKGNSGLFNFTLLEKLGHEFETILEDFKAGARQLDRNAVTMMLQVTDVLKHAVHALPDGGGQVEDFDSWMTTLTNFAQAKQQSTASADKPAPAAKPITVPAPKGESTLVGEILIEMGVIQRNELEQALARQAQPVGEILQDLGMLQEEQLDQALAVQRERRAAKTEGPARKRTSSQNIRVDLYKLDSLMNLVGELIIAENTVSQNPDLEGYELPNFRKAALQLNRISRELQDISMSLRMIPIDSTFQKMVRVVRDVSQKQNKLVLLEMSGEDTEIDKSVIENLAGPLLHIIRNAIDHGIESVEEREAAGKAGTGVVHLTAYHEGGEVVIDIRDDGRGINKERVMTKAVAKGLVNEGHEFKSDAEIYNLLFEPGFSTAEQVTDISGRGVGMDVVKKNIEAIKGRIFIQSKPGLGTSFTIRIPLTLAIIEGMLVRIGPQLFTVPLLSIRESIRINTGAVWSTIDGSEVIDIRGELVPVIRLHQIFNTRSDFSQLTDGILVVVEQDVHKFCLFVDDILGQYQTVIKGLGGFFEAVNGISGTSILSNGDISLILDVQGIVENYLNSDWDPEELHRSGIKEAAT